MVLLKDTTGSSSSTAGAAVTDEDRAVLEDGAVLDEVDGPGADGDRPRCGSGGRRRAEREVERERRPSEAGCQHP